MKILYGVQGTGNGHITRARALSTAFARMPSVNVDFIFSGRQRDKYFDMEPFAQWRNYSGLTFIHKSGKIDPIATIKQNQFRQLFKDIKTLDLSDYDLVLTDFEPVSAWAAKRAKKPILGVGHQYAFHYDIPKQGANPATELIMKNFAPVNLGLGLHWHHFGHPILPPIADIPENDYDVEKSNILVYLGFEDPEKVMQTLAPIKSHEFIFYGEFDSPQTKGNIHLKPLSREGFKIDLAKANGVICNAGFELVSEALELGKKVLVKPLKGQMEQLSNAKALENLGIGKSMSALNTETIERWLTEQPNVKILYPDVAKAIANWIVEGDWNEKTRHDLAIELWQQVESPDMNNFAHIEKLKKRL